MRDDLLHYYERELTYLRQTGAEFAKKYPRVASRLQLEPNKSDDPHVERMLEAFAFLAARVHLKIDDDFPEISEALLSVVYPDYVRPVPAMTLVQFHLDPEQGKLSSGLAVPRGSQLVTRPVGGVPCKFQTSYDTTLWPIEIQTVRWGSVADLSPPVRAPEAIGALSVRLHCSADAGFGELDLHSLRFHLNGEWNLTSTLYELLLNNCSAILLRDPGRSNEPALTLDPSAIVPVGFREDEALLPGSGRSLQAYGLVKDLFALPEKYLFLDLTGLAALPAAGFGSGAEVVFLIRPFDRSDRSSLLQTALSDDTLRLGCTPVVNLFQKASEPILLNQTRPEYLVVPDARRRETTGIYSIDKVSAITRGKTGPHRFEPFYSFRHGSDTTEERSFWSARRTARSWRPDEGTDVYLSFVDLSGRTVHPDLDSVTVQLTCHNGDLPSRLPFGDDADGDFQMPGGGPIRSIDALTKPTAAVEPPLGKPQLWRLISQLSLNYLSLVDGGAEGVREILRLHNFGDAPAAEKQISGVVGLRAERAYGRIESEHGLAFARGHRVSVEFDEEQFVGSSLYLFASVLERFLGYYASINSFVTLEARSRQRKEALKVWPPRAGRKVLV